MTGPEDSLGILRRTSGPLQQEFDAALLDLDGVVYRGPQAVPHAADAIEGACGSGMAMMFVTNNASRSPDDVAQRLTTLAIPTTPEQIVTSAQAAASLIAHQGEATTRVLAIGSDALRAALIAAGLTVVTSADEAPTVVVQGMHPSLSWRDLAEAVYAINAGADHIATNLDASVPTDRGVVLANGAMVAAVTHATGRVPRDAGKPEPWIFHQAARRSGARHPLVVGDRLSGDIAGARAAGYAGLHVLTGVDGPADLLCARPPDRPHYLGLDLRALAETHPAPTQGENGWWTCRDAVASIHEGTVRLRRAGADHDLGDGGRLSLDELRAACGAAWSASDAAGVPTVLVRPAAGLSVSG
ncbi:HAD-IIA family hydrolase [Ruania zhangjianzhongii]|uniref:HAD-IIA family hydrolase n=1 Tax=Ruania zhangjianzhongii TaxID=2603206 RepID=UPI001F253810|nr:HAD-IIA family hydrolase [Ruania zhangjianzhongii]